MNDEVIASLLRAVAAAPHDRSLVCHTAGLLIDARRGAEAVPLLAALLTIAPDDAEAQELMRRALGPATAEPDDLGWADAFDWTAADAQFGRMVEPMFVEGTPPAPTDPPVERPTVGLADVGGMETVKRRLETAFLLPMRNPELRAAYGTALGGGLLLYGPPGCGKTYLARALAGELDAGFVSVSLADVLDMFVGQSERNLHEVFRHARALAPCVLFLDEVDALGQKRSLMRSSAARTTVNQLLHELDGLGADNEGLFVLAATNHPWDVDEALRRPGRFDRTVAVLPPDGPAREAILRGRFASRPVAGIDLASVVKRTDGFSGADLVHLVDTATEYAMVDSGRTGQVRPVGMVDVESALREVRPSIGPWLDTARTVVAFANAHGEYDELRDYLAARRLL